MKRVKDSTKLEVTTVDENQSKRTREISSVNKSPEVTEKAPHCYTSTSITTTPSVLSIVQ